MSMLVKAALAFLGLFIFLLVLDDRAVKRADKIIRQNDFYFYERFDFGALDWDGPLLQNCVFDYFYKIYAYQTCFLRTAHKDSNGFDRFSYIYTAPTKRIDISIPAPGVLSMRGHNPDDYRFKLPVRDDESFKVMGDGRVFRYVRTKQTIKENNAARSPYKEVEISPQEIRERKNK